MANEVQVFEYVGDRSGDQARPAPSRVKQTLTIGGSASASFDSSTAFVTIVSTTSCVVEFGAAPTGAGDTFPIVAGQLYDFDVRHGQKVIAVAGTATAPSTGLASGAATAAKQPALGTAGSASTDVITVQGIAGGTPQQVAGGTASGSAVANAPLTTGGRAATANPTAVADAQVVNAMFDKLGKQVSISAIRTLKASQKASLSASTAETTIVAAGGAGVFNDLYGLILANTGATTTKVDIRDATGGSIIATIEVPTLETRGFMLPADSGFSQTTANNNWTAQCAASTTAMEVTALFAKNT